MEQKDGEVDKDSYLTIITNKNGGKLMEDQEKIKNREVNQQEETDLGVQVDKDSTGKEVEVSTEIVRRINEVEVSTKLVKRTK